MSDAQEQAPVNAPELQTKSAPAQAKPLDGALQLFDAIEGYVARGIEPLAARLEALEKAAPSSDASSLLKRIVDLETKLLSLETRISRQGEHLKRIEDWKQRSKAQ